uniref:glycosyltransferase n=1 Tax=Thaumasiovibrio occultus TaxID=1891184 RepID=UPI000B35AA4F|nr:glycosyltransferase [Thaumasiovibrio occultus]
MKILYHHRVAAKDGQCVHIDEIIAAFRHLGHQVYVVAPAATSKSEFGSSANWLGFIRRKLPLFVGEFLELGYSVLDFMKLRKAIKQFQPDVIYERENLFLPSGIWAKKLYRLPLILEVNSPLTVERHQYTGLSLVALARRIEHYCWREADHCLPVTALLAQYLLDAGVSDERITVMPNGINPEQFFADENLLDHAELAEQQSQPITNLCGERLPEPASIDSLDAQPFVAAPAGTPMSDPAPDFEPLTNESLVIKQSTTDSLASDQIPACQTKAENKAEVEAVTIGFVGFCREWHQLDSILELIASHHNQATQFILIGDGPVLESLKRQAETLGIADRVMFTGIVARDDIPHWLAKIDIALQPAVTPWCSPLKLIEYLATGKAIIAPNTDNIRELLVHNENALLFNSQQQVLAHIDTLLSEPKLRRQLQQNAAKTITIKALTWRQNAECIIDKFDSLLTAKHPRSVTSPHQG